MAIFLEIPSLNESFLFRTIYNDGNILTTPHWHKEFEIVYVHKGKIRAGVSESNFEVNSGEFMIVPSGKKHYIIASPDSIRYVFQFDERLFNDLKIDNNLDINLKRVFAYYPYHSKDWDDDLVRQVSSWLLELYDLDQNHKPGCYFRIKAILCNLVYQLYLLSSNYAYLKPDYALETNYELEKLDLIFRYVEDNYTQEIKLQDVADHVGYNIYYFTKFFKKCVGKTFIGFLNEYRIDKAKWILLNNDVSASEVMAQIGITNSKTYYRLFHKIVGMSPREYQKNSRS